MTRRASIVAVAVPIVASLTIGALLSACGNYNPNYPYLVMETEDRSAVMLASLGERYRTLDLGDVQLNFVEILPTETAAASRPLAVPAAPEPLPWVMVHGIGGSMGDLVMLIPRPAHQRIIAVNLPGYGGSVSRDADYSIATAARSLLQFLERLDIDRAHFICHSLGGHTCVEVLANHPSLAESLVIISPSGVQEPAELIRGVHEDFAGINAGKAAQLAADLIQSGEPGLNYEPLKWVLGYKPKRQAAWTVIRDCVRPLLPKLTMPSLIVWGANDPLFPIDDAFYMHAQMPRSELRLVDIDNHSPQMTHPEIVAAWVDDFIGARERDRVAATSGASR